jgi:preprotein translocase subunit SecY
VNKLINTIKNIWSIDELRTRILFTLGLLLIYRVGVQIVLPGVNPNMLADASKGQNGLLGLLNQFSGGAFNNVSIFALGIMPYISASIAMQLLQIAIPKFKKLGQDESGRRKLNMYTRYLTIVVTFFQALGYISSQLVYGANKAAIINDTFFWRVLCVIVMIASTLFVMWMGEKITEKGIGNGTSLIIMAGIIARLIPSLAQEWTSSQPLIFVIEIIALLATIVGIIMLTQGTRRVPLNYARRMVAGSTLSDVSGSRDFIPLKVNMANVMPIIFAQAILFIPAALPFVSKSTANWAMQLKDPTSLIYSIIYVILVVTFTFLYTALIMNPTQMSDDLKRSNAFIPGVAPGEETANYIGTIIDRITLPGALILAFIGILPSIAKAFGITSGLANFFGGTSMLIMVGVILDTLQQVEGKLLEKQYDGLMQSGRISGRTPLNSPTSVAS